MFGILTYVTSRDQTRTFNERRLGDIAFIKEIPSFAEKETSILLGK